MINSETAHATVCIIFILLNDIGVRFRVWENRFPKKSFICSFSMRYKQILWMIVTYREIEIWIDVSRRFHNAFYI